MCINNYTRDVEAVFSRMISNEYALRDAIKELERRGIRKNEPKAFNYDCAENYVKKATAERDMLHYKSECLYKGLLWYYIATCYGVEATLYISWPDSGIKHPIGHCWVRIGEFETEETEKYSKWKVICKFQNGNKV